ncbi:hypothetical protein NSTC745_07035 [Nostoc sp. DSM 114161]|jgi:hypothetical protein
MEFTLETRYQKSYITVEGWRLTVWGTRFHFLIEECYVSSILWGSLFYYSPFPVPKRFSQSLVAKITDNRPAEIIYFVNVTKCSKNYYLVTNCRAFNLQLGCQDVARP